VTNCVEIVSRHERPQALMNCLAAVSVIFLLACFLRPHRGWAAQQRPSFDCAAVASQDEKYICMDDSFAKADVHMATLYSQLLVVLPQEKRSTLRVTQRTWLANRHDCAFESNPAGCIKVLYDQRIHELQTQWAQIPAVNKSTTTSIWRTQTNPDYGFTIAYPPDFAFYSGYPNHFELNQFCEYSSVGCLLYEGRDYEGTGFHGAGLSVNVLRELRTPETCAQIANPSDNSIGKEVISGITFSSGSVRDAAAGTASWGPVYRTFYKGVCFEIAITEVASSGQYFDPPRPDYDTTQLDKKFDAIVHTFKFIGPVIDGAGWRVFHNGDVDGTFEYPENDKVVRTIKYTNERYKSSEITDSEYFVDRGLRFTVAAKVNLRDKDKLNAWFASSNYPTLDHAQTLKSSEGFTEYKAGHYYYVYGQATVYILSVTDENGQLVDPGNNRTFKHFMDSFRIE